MEQTNRKSWLGELRNTFITGLILLIPLYITIWIISLVFHLFDNAIPIIGKRFEGLGFVVTIVFIFILGSSAKNIIAKKFLKYIEDVLEKLPFIKDIYVPSKHIINTLIKSSGTKNFSKVVMVEYPRQGVYSLGFLTREELSGITSGKEKVMAGMAAVFIPTVPNPTTGFLVVIPKSELKILDMSVEQGFKLIISAGIITPDTIGVSKN